MAGGSPTNCAVASSSLVCVVQRQPRASSGAVEPYPRRLTAMSSHDTAGHADGQGEHGRQAGDRQGGPEVGQLAGSRGARPEGTPQRASRRVPVLCRGENHSPAVMSAATGTATATSGTAIETPARTNNPVCALVGPQAQQSLDHSPTLSAEARSLSMSWAVTASAATRCGSLSLEKRTDGMDNEIAASVRSLSTRIPLLRPDRRRGQLRPTRPDDKRPVGSGWMRTDRRRGSLSPVKRALATPWFRYAIRPRHPARRAGPSGSAGSR
jgi:hypothetical protein